MNQASSTYIINWPWISVLERDRVFPPMPSYCFVGKDIKCYGRSAMLVKYFEIKYKHAERGASVYPLGETDVNLSVGMDAAAARMHRKIDNSAITFDAARFPIVVIFILRPTVCDLSAYILSFFFSCGVSIPTLIGCVLSTTTPVSLHHQCEHRSHHQLTLIATRELCNGRQDDRCL